MPFSGKTVTKQELSLYFGISQEKQLQKLSISHPCLKQEKQLSDRKYYYMQAISENNRFRSNAWGIMGDSVRFIHPPAGAFHPSPWEERARKAWEYYVEEPMVNPDQCKLIIEKKLCKATAGDIEILKPFRKIEHEFIDLGIGPPCLVYAGLIATGDDRNIETVEIIYEVTRSLSYQCAGHL
jgi:hypothetical protein